MSDNENEKPEEVKETQTEQASAEQAETSSQQDPQKPEEKQPEVRSQTTDAQALAGASNATETSPENSQEQSQSEVATGNDDGSAEKKKEETSNGQQEAHTEQADTITPQEAAKPEDKQPSPPNEPQGEVQNAQQEADQGAPLSPENAQQDQTYNAGTKRANKLPMVLAGCGVLVFALMIAYVASTRAQHTFAGAKKEDHQISAQSIAEGLMSKEPEAGYTKPKMPELPKTQKPAQTPTVIPVGMPPDPDQVPPPPGNNTANVNGNGNNDDYLQQKRQLIEQEKLAQLRLFYDSTKASPFVPVTFARGAGSSPTQAQAAENNTTQQQLAALQRKINGTNDKKQNTTDDDKDKWKNTAKVEAPKSPYMLRTGAVIPAILITGINSGLKGFIEAQVSENVYDTATGKFLLIPQGSRLFGAYNNAIVYGQKRVLVMWNRITFPDGKTLDIGSMPGTDFAGYSGLKDQVDNHLLRLFGSALLMSAITAGINLSQQGFMGMHGMYGGYGYGMYGMNSSSVLSQSLGQGMGEAMQRLFQRNLNIAPTLKIRPGYPLNVMVSKDLTFSKPYRNFDY